MSWRSDEALEQARDFDGLLITPGPDLTYFTGLKPPVTERLTMLILRHGETPHLIVPRLEKPEGIDAETWSDGDDPYELVARRLGRGRYAISDSAWAMHLLELQRPGLTFTSMTKALPMLRAVKDADEVERLAAAGVAADKTFDAVKELRFGGRTEKDVAADLARLLQENGHEQVDFTIVAAGPNGANPHHEAGDRVIAHGDMVVLDFGGLKNGYGSDTTRTVHVGRPTGEEQEVHDIVRLAQQAASDAVRPGVECQEIDRVARQVIVDAGYGEFFIHRTGHGIGLETHEPPYLVRGETQPLVPGMCFSIEPGIYLPGRFGVRIEDIVTVTPDGGRRLNNTERTIVTVV
ncbi:dipeptidase [Paractinoplanes abujensis]|uniref:D-alanyl-D-alanine dipeptidase n=1 Tax=Paractinoplanes abujensis TaxID=882441 RepID=A0A7W7CK69_9ACTN|nr:aminopeptidase P family protein [Actinoplanes abujensis]MBB4690074.1 D-alanyl-D-alanine dipeptidase [Actinoplanes abujensis]GID20847.1 dipeptidase [Actinoplanes abujensis]